MEESLNVVVNVTNVLSKQQLAIVKLMKQNKSLPQIAAQLGVGISTINTHLRQIRKRLGVSSCADLRNRLQ